MRLSQFLSDADLSATEFALRVGCEVSTITRLCKGERKPSLDLALKIEAATDGKVGPHDFSPTKDGEDAA